MTYTSVEWLQDVVITHIVIVMVTFDSGCKSAFSELQSFYMHFNSKGTEGLRSVHVWSASESVM